MMKLKYVGKHSPIMVEGVDGKLVSVATGGLFDCTEKVGDELMKKFNIAGKKPVFEVAGAAEPDKKMMAEPSKKKADKEEKVEPIA